MGTYVDVGRWPIWVQQRVATHEKRCKQALQQTGSKGAESDVS